MFSDNVVWLNMNPFGPLNSHGLKLTGDLLNVLVGLKCNRNNTRSILLYVLNHLALKAFGSKNWFKRLICTVLKYKINLLKCKLWQMVRWVTKWQFFVLIYLDR